jgi:hypothetical protein
LNLHVAKTAKYILVLGIALAAICVAAGVVASRRYGSAAYTASAVAALINWGAGSAALATIAVGRSQPWRTQSVLLAMIVRMVPVLAAAIWFTRSGSSLASSGVAGLIVVHYLAGLLIETLMSVRLASSGLPSASMSPPALSGAPRNSES